MARNPLASDAPDDQASLNPLASSSWPGQLGVTTADAMSHTIGTVSDWLANQRAQSAAMGMWNEKTGLPTAEGLHNAMLSIALGTSRSPGDASLVPAIRLNGKIYSGPEGSLTHFDALNNVPQELRARAMSDGANRGYITESGKYLNRFDAADYAKDNNLIDPAAPYYAATSPELIAEWLKRQ